MELVVEFAPVNSVCARDVFRFGPTTPPRLVPYLDKKTAFASMSAWNWVVVSRLFRAHSFYQHDIPSLGQTGR